MSLIKKEPIDFISKDQQFVADFYRAERRKLLTHLICTFDKSPEAPTPCFWAQSQKILKYPIKKSILSSL